VNVGVSVTSSLYNPPQGRMMVRGEGVFVYDECGRNYLDAGAGTFNLSLGYSHPDIVSVVQDQATRLIHLSGSLRSQPIEDLADRLCAVSPSNLTRVHLKSSGGSTANEGAIKIARRVTQGRDVVTLFRSHHGQTALTTAASGQSFRRADQTVPLAGLVQLPDPYCHRCFYGQKRDVCDLLCVDRIADFLDHAGTGRPACMLVEPISGNGGNVVLPDGYLRRVRKLCDELGMLLILDEIQTGIGRTGRMFAAEHWGVRADMITVGKGLGGSGLQIAAILTEERLLGMEPGEHSFTYGGNVLAAAAACKTLDIVSDASFLAQVREVGDYLKKRLRDLAAHYRWIGDVRGLGLMLGLEINKNDGSRDVPLALEIARQAPAHGLLLRTSEYGRGNVVKIRPPLIVTMDEADILCDRLEATFNACV
jgi:4-aminobutyrate aminotransferase-like enzyme